MTVAFEELLHGQRTARTTPRPTFTRPTKSPQQEEKKDEEKGRPLVSLLLRSYSSGALVDTPPPTQDQKEVGKESRREKASGSPVRAVPRQHLSQPPSPDRLHAQESKSGRSHTPSHSHNLRPLSMGVWNPDVAYDSSFNVSSASIAVCTQSRTIAY